MFYTIKRGDIFYISKEGTEVGSEQTAGRPAIVVSNDTANEVAPVIEIVYLTTKEKKDLPTHVEIKSRHVKSTALCEQITTVAKSRIGDYYGSCSEDEMSSIDKAIMISLALDNQPTQTATEDDAENSSRDAQVKQLKCELEQVSKNSAQVQSELTKVIAERDVYKELYTELIRKTAEGRV